MNEQKRTDESPQPEPWFLRQDDVAALTGLSAGEVRRAIKSGKLKARRYGKRAVLISPNDVRDWIDRETTLLENVA